jgi:hypothetical protein
VTASTLLGVLMACAAVPIGTTIGWLCASGVARLLRDVRWSARARASLLAQARLLPLAFVIVLVAAQVHAFARFETSRAESAGPLLTVLALAGVMLVADAIWRAAMAWRATARLTAEWRASATALSLANWARPAWAIRPTFPVVAVIGAFRPQLFVAQQVVDGCTSRELAAIAAHEAAHIAARDNLIRLLFEMTPGARAFARVADAIERQWRAAAEEAADAAASRNSDRLDLASALTKVARLAPITAPESIAASALIDGSDLQARVRRLIDAPPEPPLQRVAVLPALLLLALAAASQLPQAGASLHELFELLVRTH